MELKTKQEFKALPEEARVHVEYSSRYISEFSQTFSRARYPEVVKISAEEWSALWDTYHGYDVKAVSFKLISD